MGLLGQGFGLTLPNEEPLPLAPCRIDYGRGRSRCRLRTSCVSFTWFVGTTPHEMSTESVASKGLHDGTKPLPAPRNVPVGPREASAERASQLRAARRQAERRQATVVAQWLRRLHKER